MKAILCLSGGLDSTVLLWHLATMPSVTEIRCLSVDYGQRHRRELEAAEKISAIASSRFPDKVLEHKVIDLTNIKQLLLGSSQTDDKVEVPEGHYAEENMKKTVVPNRNMIFLALATAWAVSTKSSTVAIAAHTGDRVIYPDCREGFMQAMNTAIGLCDWHEVNLWRPFIDWDKAAITIRGADLHAPLRFTHSCYKGGEKHCGRCGTCVERLEAFSLAKLNDPVEYEDREYYKIVKTPK